MPSVDICNPVLPNRIILLVELPIIIGFVVVLDALVPILILPVELINIFEISVVKTLSIVFVLIPPEKVCNADAVSVIFFF